MTGLIHDWIPCEIQYLLMLNPGARQYEALPSRSTKMKPKFYETEIHFHNETELKNGNLKEARAVQKYHTSIILSLMRSIYVV